MPKRSISMNQGFVRVVTKKIKYYNPVALAVNAVETIWTPRGGEQFALLAVYAKCRSVDGSITTPPQVSLLANSVTIVTAGVLPVVQGDIRQMATLQTNIAAQITAAHPLVLKLTTDVVLNTATALLYDFLICAVKFEDFGF